MWLLTVGRLRVVGAADITGRVKLAVKVKIKSIKWVKRDIVISFVRI